MVLISVTRTQWICSSAIIEDVRALCQADPSSILAYFYLTDKSDLEDLIRSILSQLSAKATPGVLATLYDRYQDSRQHPPMKDLVASIPPILEGFGHVYLIFDALDECPKRRELLCWLEGIISAKLDGVHLLVTSRWEGEIIDSLEPLIPDVIDIGSQVHDDITIYIREALRTDQRFTRHKWPEVVQEKIQTTLEERAKGMYDTPGFQNLLMTADHSFQGFDGLPCSLTAWHLAELPMMYTNVSNHYPKAWTRRTIEFCRRYRTTITNGRLGSWSASHVLLV